MQVSAYSLYGDSSSSFVTEVAPSPLWRAMEVLISFLKFADAIRFEWGLVTFFSTGRGAGSEAPGLKGAAPMGVENEMTGFSGYDSMVFVKS